MPNYSHLCLTDPNLFALRHEIARTPPTDNNFIPDIPELMVIGTRLSPSPAAVPRPARTVVAFGRGQTTANAVAAKKAAVAERAQTTTTAKTAPGLSGTSNSMRRSGSLGHLVTSASAIHAQANLNGQRTLCKCSEPDSVAFLEGVYVQNLQTQIEVLELENAYLRGATERGALFAKHHQTSPSSAVFNRGTSTTATTKTMNQRNSAALRMAEKEEEEEEEEEEEGEEDEKDVEEEEKEEVEKQHRRQRHSTAIGTPKRRVAFINDHRPPPPHYRRRQGAESSSSSAEEAATASVDEMYGIDGTGGRDNGTRHQQRKLERSTYDGATPGAEGVSHAAAAAAEDERRRRRAAERLQQEAELRAVDAEQQLRQAEERAYGEKRALLADSAELQRRLDELTPKLAEQEAKMLALDEQRDDANVRLKATVKQLNVLQANLADRTRESRQLESDKERNVQRLQRQLEELGRELDGARAREEAINIELDRAKNRLVEEESRNQREMLAQSRTEHEEKSKLEAQLMEAHQNGELASAELELARERLAKEQEAVRALSTKLKERQLEDEQRGSARLRVQRELEALQSLSNSLANENKGLREERGALEERLNELKQRVHQKDSRDHRLAELVSEFFDKHRQSAQRAKIQIGRQTEDCEQFEQIAEKIRQIAGTGTSPPRASATTTTSVSSSRTASSTRRSKMD